MRRLRYWLAEIKDRDELVFAPVLLTRETYQILDHARRKYEHGTQMYQSLVYILIGGMGMMLGGLFAEEVMVTLAGAILTMSAFVGLLWISIGYKYRPGTPSTFRKITPEFMMFDEAGTMFPLRERQEKMNEDLKKILGKG
jgi:hypothetical protein